jgi:UDP-3-O-[3-hydroxymyristoyl] glucosamine N-acyltransferase
VSKSYRLGELARRVGGEVLGKVDRPISGIAPLGEAGPDDLSFLTNAKYRKEARKSGAGAVLAAPGSGLEGIDILEVREPYLALASLLELFHPPAPRRPGISGAAHVGTDVTMGSEVAVGPFAVIADRVTLGDRATVGAGCVVGEECRVGDDAELKPRVVLYPRTVIGKRCLIHSGVVLGADGFGFATSGNLHHKVPQVGRVVIEDDVEIGANATVDRAAIGETLIGEGSKIDNLVMIAHGVKLGRGALMAAQTGISGSTRIGERTTWAGQSGAAGHLKIGDGAIIAAKTAVLKDLPAGAFVIGIPAVEHGHWKRVQVSLSKLPELRQEVRKLRSRLERLEALLNKEGTDH